MLGVVAAVAIRVISMTKWIGIPPGGCVIVNALVPRNRMALRHLACLSGRPQIRSKMNREDGGSHNKTTFQIMTLTDKISDEMTLTEVAQATRLKRSLWLASIAEVATGILNSTSGYTGSSSYRGVMMRFSTITCACPTKRENSVMN
jgi:hypothetical protein